MSRTSDKHTVPRALIHAKILDAAADAPEASMEAIASEVPSATTDLVERVLETYGDPATDQDDTPSTETDTGPSAAEDPEKQSQSVDDQDEQSADPADTAVDSVAPSTEEQRSVDEEEPNDEDVEVSDSSSESVGDEDTSGDEADDPSSDRHEPSSEQPGAMTESDHRATEADAAPMPPTAHAPDPDELSRKQREVLEAIAERPDATQREIADRIGVSAPTVSNRANSIEGFEWAERREFVDAVFKRNGVRDDSASETGAQSETRAMAINDTELTTAIEQLIDRIDELEERLDDLDRAASDSPFEADHELAHKVAHACLQSDAITEEEELEILKALLE